MKTLLITGGSSGIGLAITQHFLSLSWQVINIDKNTPDTVVQNDNYHYVYADLNETEKINTVFKTALDNTKHIDVLIHNAAMQENMPFNKLTPEHLDHAYNVNIKAPVLLSQLFAKQFRKKHGRIIHITSTRADMSEEDTIAYTMSKGALKALTHSLAITLAKQHITVNAVAPGWINSKNASISNTDHAFHPSNRVGKPMDIVKAVQYIIDEDNDFLNAETITVDGGVTKKMVYPK